MGYLEANWEKSQKRGVPVVDLPSRKVALNCEFQGLYMYAVMWCS